MEIKYTVLLEKDEEGGYIVTVPSLPGCITQGDTWSEALEHAKEAILGYLETMEDLGKLVPVELPIQVAL